MTKDRLRAILTSYIEKLAAEGFNPRKRDDLREHPFEHVLWMAYETLEHIDKNRWDKAQRWLGFIQGILVLAGFFDLAKVKEHNKTTEPDAEKNYLYSLEVGAPKETTHSQVRKVL